MIIRNSKGVIIAISDELAHQFFDDDWEEVEHETVFAPDYQFTPAETEPAYLGFDFGDEDEADEADETTEDEDGDESPADESEALGDPTETSGEALAGDAPEDEQPAEEIVDEQPAPARNKRSGVGTRPSSK